jgi:hypothetical protein
MLFKGTDKYGTQDWAKEKSRIDKIGDLYEQYNNRKTTQKKKTRKRFDPISGVVSNFIANEYDKMIVSNGSVQGTNAFTL